VARVLGARSPSRAVSRYLRTVCRSHRDSHAEPLPPGAARSTAWGLFLTRVCCWRGRHRGPGPLGLHLAARGRHCGSAAETQSRYTAGEPPSRTVVAPRHVAPRGSESTRAPRTRGSASSKELGSIRRRSTPSVAESKSSGLAQARAARAGLLNGRARDLLGLPVAEGGAPTSGSAGSVE